MRDLDSHSSGLFLQFNKESFGHAQDFLREDYDPLVDVDRGEDGLGGGRTTPVRSRANRLLVALAVVQKL